MSPQERQFLTDLEDHNRKVEKLQKELRDKINQRDIAERQPTDNNVAYFKLKDEIRELVDQIESELKNHPKYY